MPKSNIMELIGPGKPVEWVRFKPPTEHLDLYQAVARWGELEPIFGKSDMRLAGGTAHSSQRAAIKAVSEAYERYISGRVKVDTTAAASELEEPWLDPRPVRPLTDEQYAKLPYLEQFDENKPIQWIRGLCHDGSSILVPIDLVFCQVPPKVIGRKYVVDIDSSGMAAYPTVEGAAQLGLLELIERDAIMKLWFTRKPSRRIKPTVLPSYYQQRVSYWQKLDKELEILDLSHNGIAIVLVIIRSPDGGFPYLASGAAASMKSFVNAVDKALQEAEVAFSFELSRKKQPKPIAPEDVKTADDHGMLYCHDTYKQQVEWLWSGKMTASLPKVEKGKNPSQLYKPIVMQLTDSSEPLQVVRVICPKLVPINFGFGSEHYSHPSLKGMPIQKSAMPHFFA